MKNKLLDLNNHLFAQLERLNNEDLKKEDLAEEIRRSGALVDVANAIITNGQLALDAVVAEKEWQLSGKRLPMLEGPNDKA
jgi:hypothetical protein